MNGFVLNAVKIAEKISRFISEPGWHLSIDFDFHEHLDFGTGMFMEWDDVDRAVVTFVGTREEAGLVYEAARRSLSQ